MAQLLGETSKTGIAFGLGAGPIKDGGTCPASVCSGLCQKCYARPGSGGNYDYSVVTNAHIRRLAETKLPTFVPAMTEELVAEAGRSQKRGESVLFFRGHDSGDFYVPEYIDKWTAIVESVRRRLRRKPVTVRYWFPTRTWIFTRWMPSLVALNAQQGVAVHPSALEVDDPLPVVAGLSAGSSVGLGWGNCPAVENGVRNKKLPADKKLPTSCKGCGCRRCWSKAGEAVYRLH